MKALLLGDVSPTVITNPLFDKKDVKTLFTDVVTLFEGNDINFVNLECAITESEKSIEKFGPALKASRNTVDVLKNIGVNCCGLSNNHIFDFGIQGVKDTMQALEQAGIAYTGFGKDYDDSRKDMVYSVDGETLALIAVCEHEYSYALEDRMGSRPYDEYDTMEDIRKSKEVCDRVVVFYHGGKEHCQYPSPRLRKLCRAMVRNGADVVLCQHSHCIGCYENYQDGHILYGQGNFHFVKPGFVALELEKTWNSSLAVKYDSKENNIEFIPVVNSDHGITLAKGEEKERVLQEFAARNEELEDGRWKDGWHAFCERTGDLYRQVIGSACTEQATEMQNKMFGHYLDCEAHTDVWRELFPTANQTNEK